MNTEVEVETMIKKVIKNSRIFRLVWETNFTVGPRVINMVGGIHGHRNFARRNRGK